VFAGGAVHPFSFGLVSQIYKTIANIAEIMVISAIIAPVIV